VSHRDTAATPLVDHGEQRTQSHDGGGVIGEEEFRLPAQRAHGRTDRPLPRSLLSVVTVTSLMACNCKTSQFKTVKKDIDYSLRII